MCDTSSSLPPLVLYLYYTISPSSQPRVRDLKVAKFKKKKKKKKEADRPERPSGASKVVARVKAEARLTSSGKEEEKKPSSVPSPHEKDLDMRST